MCDSFFFFFFFFGFVCLDSAHHKDFNFFPPCFGALIICR